jgi:hypothetical protein
MNNINFPIPNFSLAFSVKDRFHTLTMIPPYLELRGPGRWFAPLKPESPFRGEMSVILELF